MKKAKLSKRLHKASEFVVPDQPVLDIGSDHAYLPIYLVQENKIPSAIAGEVAEGPYKNAEEKVAQNELENRISIRLGDGLAVLKPTETVGTIFICGMGGSLIADIFTRGLANNQLPKKSRLVLQPNNAEESLRKELVKANYEIIDEVILEEKGKIYEIMIAEYSEELRAYTEDDYLFGPKLLKERSEVFIKKWSLEKQKLEKILDQLKQTPNTEKVKQLSEKIRQIEQVIS